MTKGENEILAGKAYADPKYLVYSADDVYLYSYADYKDLLKLAEAKR